jgi:hypothetical protein
LSGVGIPFRFIREGEESSFLGFDTFYAVDFDDATVGDGDGDGHDVRNLALSLGDFEDCYSHFFLNLSLIFLTTDFFDFFFGKRGTCTSAVVIFDEFDTASLRGCLVAEFDFEGIVDNVFHGDTHFLDEVSPIEHGDLFTSPLLSF